jgi:hypothetical protein
VKFRDASHKKCIYIVSRRETKLLPRTRRRRKNPIVVAGAQSKSWPSFHNRAGRLYLFQLTLHLRDRLFHVSEITPVPPPRLAPENKLVALVAPCPESLRRLSAQVFPSVMLVVQLLVLTTQAVTYGNKRIGEVASHGFAKQLLGKRQAGNIKRRYEQCKLGVHGNRRNRFFSPAKGKYGRGYGKKNEKD